ncbi:hypothetical protein K493DRAFT_315643 [Basidiobolus meristosporus CBS 931.73]|uniref:Uncharacterized protein n=1 Tax=Basidiobolus meristosporus CBS 931.73 TaxID=1314790 RepID=A0A1Y1Y804_9FUNG|nr:hypothetical protein K493DRAFT_315643 [Basidiobolus meristosporus CBS 931.73]|eukprot:ORX94133.1 hypothetical protein K493DRAFT_315643 [Basidiobolus meristosporus CBS 931.73]
MKFAPVVFILFVMLLNLTVTEAVARRRPRRGIKDIHGNTLSYVIVTLAPTPTPKKTKKRHSATQTTYTATPVLPTPTVTSTY